MPGVLFECMESSLKHGNMVLQKGQTVFIDKELAAYFCSAGWGVAVGADINPRAPSATTLTLVPTKQTLTR